jgi:hypothetical protein
MGFDAFSKGARAYKNLAREIIKMEDNKSKKFTI